MADSRQLRPLYDAITQLAGSPDDVSDMDTMLLRIASLTVSLVTPIEYASITAQRDGAPTTVALSSETALAIDEAQYADQKGPCLAALEEAEPVGAVIASTMVWPGFREAALTLGIQASLSIPLFAGSGQTIAALNLYARDSMALAPLTSATINLFNSYQHQPPPSASDTGIIEVLDDAGGRELLAGVAEAFAIQHRIHIAIGVLMQREAISAEWAYAYLRENAAASGNTLLDCATAVIDMLTRD